MIVPTTSFSKRIRVALVQPDDRPLIYAARHEIYARELRQHSENPKSSLSDPLDERNEYIVAKQGDELLGFVSLTPPGGLYSIDKYFRREQLPLEFNDGLYEVRLLSVLSAHRGRLVAPLLMYAALRYVGSHGGSRLVAIGRREVMDLYTRCGMKPHGITTKAGAVQFDLMTASIGEVNSTISAFARQLSRMNRSVDWQLPFPFHLSTHCEHGGSLWNAIGHDFTHIADAGQVINADVLDAWFEPAPAVMNALRENLALFVRTSPPTHAEGMVLAISQARTVPRACVLTAAGSSALIFLAFQNWLNSSSRALLLDPTYGEYRHVLENVIGCAVRSVVARKENCYRVDVHQVEQQVAEGCSLVVLVNPNSPTGTIMSRSALIRLFSRFENTRFWVDETYLEFAGAENSVEQFAAQSANVFVCKSMSKVYALSGVRAAYMVGPEAEIARLGRLIPPWAVSLPAQVAAVAALSSSDYYNAQYRRTAELR